MTKTDETATEYLAWEYDPRSPNPFKGAGWFDNRRPAPDWMWDNTQYDPFPHPVKPAQPHEAACTDCHLIKRLDHMVAGVCQDCQ